ncbi:two-component response regulator ORR22-like [Impatiens glandulifera]|uniref:two-component response regulator ORR22-like n=1 Tax=Impatiens glandulifera TaxID=253017 RepID=UPI001FB0D972|nr:two-component response regulator ORR22-like [Impatiens glandulifera]
MTVEGLTRENVASHLQKYRLYLKRISAAAATNQQGNMVGSYGNKDLSFIRTGCNSLLEGGDFQTLSGSILPSSYSPVGMGMLGRLNNPVSISSSLLNFPSTAGGHLRQNSIPDLGKFQQLEQLELEQGSKFGEVLPSSNSLGIFLDNGSSSSSSRLQVSTSLVNHLPVIKEVPSLYNDDHHQAYNGLKMNNSSSTGAFFSHQNQNIDYNSFNGVHHEQNRNQSNNSSTALILKQTKQAGFGHNGYDALDDLMNSMMKQQDGGGGGGGGVLMMEEGELFGFGSYPTSFDSSTNSTTTHPYIL